MEDAVHVWGQEVYGNLSLAMNIKLPYKIKFINLKKKKKEQNSISNYFLAILYL
jgi:hypothetical protein